MTLREQKRWHTARRITLCAQALVSERGLDGFTVDELAEAADVSRRTLFNYFPSKTDAVLGATPDIPEAALETFRAGGPHGHVVDDLAELARVALSVEGLDKEVLARSREVLLAEPRLIAAVHQRFEGICAEFSAVVAQREGPGFGPSRPRLLVGLVLVMLESALTDFLAADDDRSLVDCFDQQLRETRALLA